MYLAGDSQIVDNVKRIDVEEFEASEHCPVYTLAEDNAISSLEDLASNS